MAYPALLSEVRLGPAVLRNRVVSTAHQTGLVHDHLPTDDLVAYHEARARGGVGAVFIEATATHETGLLTAHTIGGYLPGDRRRLRAPRRGRARPRRAAVRAAPPRRARADRRPAAAARDRPVGRPDAALPRRAARADAGGDRRPRRRLRHVRPAGARGRRRRHRGLDGARLPRGPVLRRRRRTRATTPTTATSRPACGSPARCSRRCATRRATEIAVGVRLAADEITPDGFGPEACAEIAAALCAGSEIDFVSAALGTRRRIAARRTSCRRRPSRARRSPGRWRRCARRSPASRSSARRAMADLDAAERLVGCGAVDLVGMTRAMIADPDLLAKAAAGRDDEVIPCIGCNQGCIGHYHAGLPIACIVNPRTGRERTLPRPAPAALRGRRVLVAGGGPAGVAAALEAAARRARGRARGAQRASSAASSASPAARPRTARRGSATSAGSPTGSMPTASTCAWRPRSRPATPRTYDAVVARDRRRAVPPAAARRDAVRGRRRARRDPRPRRDRRARSSSPTGAAAGPASTPPRRSPRPGSTVTYACAGAAIGEGVHQYQRNLYLARLDRAAVAPPSTTRRSWRSAVRPCCATSSRAATEPLPDGLGTLVLAQGRVPDDGAVARRSGGGRAVRARRRRPRARAAPRRRCWRGRSPRARRWRLRRLGRRRRAGRSCTAMKSLRRISSAESTPPDERDDRGHDEQVVQRARVRLQVGVLRRRRRARDARDAGREHLRRARARAGPVALFSSSCWNSAPRPAMPGRDADLAEGRVDARRHPGARRRHDARRRSTRAAG